MLTQKFIIKYFTEIMVKGPSARRQMADQLFGNLQKIMFQISPEIKLRKFYDKIEIVTPKDIVPKARLKLLEIPGIEQVLEALQFDNVETIDDIKPIVQEYMSKNIQGKSFVIRAKRVGSHSFKSPQIEQEVGGYMLSVNPRSSVDLHNPQVTINIELINNQLNIISLKHRGLGGFPLGSQGEVLSLMSGGFDSTVASYLTMKRGLKTHFIFFNLGGLAHEIGVKQVAYYLWEKFASTHRVSFISVPFDDVVSEIFNSIHESYMGVMLKRLMLEASQKIADDMGIDALLTGESIAQVSSQTLRNLALIDEVTDKLVIRPLSTMNKPDIIDIADKIGTKEFAETMPEYCGVISKGPVTHGSFARVQKEANKFNYTVLDKAVENSKKIYVDEIEDDIQEIGQVQTISDISSGKYVIIDIRQGDECIQTPCETLKIPFYKLKTQFKKLPQEREYLFYCDKGILSQLHAQFLRDSENFGNIKVYRP